MSNIGIRLIATAVVAVVTLAAFGIREHVLNRRDRALISAEFPRGTDRATVVTALGEPDQEFVGEAMRNYSLGHKCHDISTRVLKYFPPRDSGAYCEVYLDQSDRVVCVEHGFIAR